MSEIIFQDDPQAARYVTNISGWVSRNGKFYGEGSQAEQAARYDGSTHVRCECGEPARHPYTCCESCRDQRDFQCYMDIPAVEWDGKSPIYSHVTDEYYNTPDDVFEAIDNMDDEITPDDLRLVLCKPNYARKMDEGDYHDDLPEDGDAPDALLDAIEAFNKAVDGIILSWSPGKHRLIMR